MAGMRTVSEMKQSLDNTCNEHGEHDIELDFQVLTSIYCKKRITVKC